ncbi:ATP synthase F0 subunit B [Bdellovibrio sp. HCB209]|uniref:ATP synthase F0 subunit B n=1 Tax=Bdellovibrio sp. HCB209 TaxID=3394354 RepID=UPI0039B38F94
MKVLVNLLIMLAPAIVFAASAEHGGEHHAVEIPSAVIYQAINVAVLIGGLIYFTKDAIVSFFGGRKSAYLEAAQKSAFAREQAEREFVDIKNKLANLENTRQEQLAKAQAHANDLKNQIVEEANQVSKRIKDEAELTAKLETQRAQKELRHQLLTDSVEAARIVLTKDIGASDQQKLQNEFINHIEVSR